MGFDLRTYIGLGKHRLLEGTNNLVPTRTQEKGAVTPQDTERDLPVSVQESLAEVWVDSDLLQDRGTEYNVCMSPLEGSCHYPHYPYHSLV